MKRMRFFIAIVTFACVVATPAFGAKKSVVGKVLCDGKGVEGVVVTDGVNMVKTGADGAYSLSTNTKNPHCQFVHISTPSGYEVERIGNAPQFYKRVNPKAKVNTINFSLTKVDQSVYSVFTIADSHVCAGLTKHGHKDDRARYCATVVPTLKAQVAKSEGPAYIISLGDMTQSGTRPGWKGRAEGYSFLNYMEDTAVDRPIFNSVGNHDHNRAPEGVIFNDETVYRSREDYNRELGPEYYSFTLGREH